MNKSEFISAVAERTGSSIKDTTAAVNAGLEIIKEQLAAKQEVEFTGFGKFLVKEHAERQGRNPSTGESITIPASIQPGFKAGKALKDAVQK